MVREYYPSRTRPVRETGGRLGVRLEPICLDKDLPDRNPHCLFPDTDRVLGPVLFLVSQGSLLGDAESKGTHLALEPRP